MHVSCWQRCANTPEPLVGACLFEVVMGVKTVIYEQSVREPGANYTLSLHDALPI